MSSATAVLAMASPGIDWLYQFTNNFTNHTTQNGGALTQQGLVEAERYLAFHSCQHGHQLEHERHDTSLPYASRSCRRSHELSAQVDRLLPAQNYWVNPFPGASFGINHLLSYIAQAMVAAFDQNSLDQLLQLLKTAGDGTAMPSFTAPVQILCYMLVQIMLGLASAILFVINCSAFILYGVAALFGPIFVPLLMTQTFRAKFFHFMDVLIGFAMIRAVAAAFIFVWSGFMNGFLQQTFNGNYSMEMWIANLIPCLMVFIAFIINMLFIPSMTQAIFGGAAGLVSAAPRSAQYRQQWRAAAHSKSGGACMCGTSGSDPSSPMSDKLRSAALGRDLLLSRLRRLYWPLALIYATGVVLHAISERNNTRHVSTHSSH